ncbi:MAG: serine hydroxymethyltransferase, partial [Anaerohalosphaera sp.]|nr:serine hydroxymethyltransferase [Anaerohalosphaera sp.]
YEAMQPNFLDYQQAILDNALVLATELQQLGLRLISGGTDNHLILMDLRSKGMLGKKLAKALDSAGIVTNYNTIPNDPAKPFNPSGIRIGTPAVTTRGMKEEQMDTIAELFNEVTANVEDENAIANAAEKVKQLCSQFPVPDSFVS